MTKNVYVGNLSFETNQAKLQELAEAHGQVSSVNVITDRDTGRPRGFAFVEMATEEGARALISATAPSSVAISTNANPRGRPVSRSVITLTEVTCPCASASSCSVAWFVSKLKFPTYTFFVIFFSLLY
jgi:RNA recognition motif-containing protein